MTVDNERMKIILRGIIVKLARNDTYILTLFYLEEGAPDNGPQKLARYLQRMNSYVKISWLGV